jgi:D-alanyl-D-alanine carboxypeptidase/D-alanyl-D-alanine-endopeptidase (penicillin-binding protein 4)
VIRAVACLAIAVGGAGFVAPGIAATLPRPVALALERARMPPDALVAVVQEVGASRSRLAWQTDQPVNPASLMKLFTTFAALDLLGPNWTWSTPVWLHGTVRDGVLYGDLVIQGSGDPTLVLERLWLLLRRVQQLGVREVRGDIVLDRNAFAVPERDPAEFDGKPLRPYNVRPDALMLNYKSLMLGFIPDAAQGLARITTDPPLAGVRIDASVPLAKGPCGDWRGALQADFSDTTRIRFAGSFAAACGEKRWPMAYADPQRYNERALLGLWQAMGGKLDGRVRDGVAPADAPSFVFASPPLADVVRDMNKFSNNVMAQQLFLTLGWVASGVGTPQTARDALHQWAAQRLGPDATDLVIDNGSGLSRDNRVTARLLARLLQSAWTTPLMSELMSSFPISGLDGTLKRSHTTPGRAHLKTGSRDGVRGVAGYVLANSGQRYVVVALLSDPNAEGDAARSTLDAVVQWAIDDNTLLPQGPGTPK